MQDLKTIATLVLIAAGCGSSNPTKNPDAPMTGSDAGADGSSFDSAIDITAQIDSATPIAGKLPDTKTKIYYKATLAAGDRMLAATATQAANVTDGSVTDTFVTIYDSSHAPIAQDDDAWPRPNTDSTVLFEAQGAGTYFLTVEDCNSAHSSGCYPAAGVTDFTYALGLDHLSKIISPEINAAATQDGTTAHAQPIPYTVPSGGTAGDYGYYTIDGNFASATATHVYSFTAPAATILTGSRMHAEFFVQPIGADNGDGSTSNIRIWVTASDGTTILAQADQSKYKDGDNATDGPLDISVPVTKNMQYYLFVQNTASASNPTTDYYFIEHFIGQFYYGTQELEAMTVKGTNDTKATAQALMTPQGADAGSFFADGNIGAAGDADWYEVDPPAGATMASLSCEAARAGSGVAGLTMTLFAADGTTGIGAIGPETATADLFNANAFTVPANTTQAFIQVTASAQDPNDTGTYYRCNVFYQ
ncbi:MAG TPA: hypothetical protein VGF94_02605 [Kofleriaceae bacterium]|jgi:hypothetical protein